MKVLNPAFYGGAQDSISAKKEPKQTKQTLESKETESKLKSTGGNRPGGKNLSRSQPKNVESKSNNKNEEIIKGGGGKNIGENEGNNSLYNNNNINNNLVENIGFENTSKRKKNVHKSSEPFEKEKKVVTKLFIIKYNIFTFYFLIDTKKEFLRAI